MAFPATQQITRLESTHEGEDREGRLVGKLTDQDGRPVYQDDRWVLKRDALRIARDLGVELFEF